MLREHRNLFPKHLRMCLVSPLCFFPRLFFLVFLIALLPCLAPAISVAEESPLVGRLRSVRVKPGVTLMETAVDEGVGYQSLVNANPDLDPWLPQPETQILLPLQAIVPEGAAPGLTINLAELRLYQITPGTSGRRVRFYPIGIGSEGWETPLGPARVICRVKDPVWAPPANIRAERPELPATVPPGPSNPLGSYWIGLSLPGIGLHGTHKPMGVGRRVSHGCIRLYAGDIRTLYETIETGTPVSIVYQPIKAAVQDGRLYLEVHPDYLEQIPNPLQAAWDATKRAGWKGGFDYGPVLKALEEQRGVPVPVSSAGAVVQAPNHSPTP